VKVTNISQSVLYLKDLKVTHESQTEGRRGEDRYLGAGRSIYLQNTSEVLRSAYAGDLAHLRDAGYVTLEDQVTLAANGDSGDHIVLTHNFTFPPAAYVLKKVGAFWVDATGTVDISHNLAFTTTTIVNAIASSQILLIRLV
jgi:hypothetical protein